MERCSINATDSDDEGACLLINGDTAEKYSHVKCREKGGAQDSDVLKSPSWLTSKRWQVAYLMFFGCFFQYALRVDLSVAIVCMCNSTDSGDNATTDTDTDATNNHAEFSWGESTKSTLLSAYFYGYLVLQVPGGWLAGKYGATRVISLTMALSALCTLLIPLAARNSLVAFYALRVLIGFVAGATFPAFQSLWGRWAPAEERTRLAGFSYSGGFLGSIVTFAVSGVLCDHGFGGGWPSIFYLLGGLALLWCLIWHAVVYDSPSSHPTISVQEREHIVNSLQENSQKSPSVPWKSMFTSASFYTLIFTMLAMGWVDYTVMTSLPQYLRDMLDFDISQDGLLSASPSVCQFASSLLVGPLADWIRAKGVPTGMVRKLFQFSTFVGRAACLLAAGYVTYDKRYAAIGLLGVSGFFAGLQQAGYVANFIDIAPRFTGVMYGFGNSMATVSGIISPAVVGAVTTQNTHSEWQTVFLVCAALSVTAALIFVCFAQGHVQEWAIETPPGSNSNGDLRYDIIIEADEGDEDNGVAEDDSFRVDIDDNGQG